jgi:ribonucleotide reductase alpha subunit
VTDFAFSSFVVHGFGIGFRVRQEAKQKAAAEAKAKAEAEAKLKQEEAAKQKAAAEAKANTEADRKAAEAKRQQEEDKHKQETALNQLAEMGLTDRNGNKKLLEQSRNDVATVVDLLSQEASTDQRRENEGGRGRSVESGGARGRGSCLEEGRCYVDTSRSVPTLEVEVSPMSWAGRIDFQDKVWTHPRRFHSRSFVEAGTSRVRCVKKSRRRSNLG